MPPQVLTTFTLVGAESVMLVPSKSPLVGLIGRLKPDPTLSEPTDQTLLLVGLGPESVSRLVAVNVNDRPACICRLLVTRLLAVMETSPFAYRAPLVSVVVSDWRMKEPTPFETMPPLSKLPASMIEPWFIKTPLLMNAVLKRNDTTFVVAAAPPRRVLLPPQVRLDDTVAGVNLVAIELP